MASIEESINPATPVGSIVIIIIGGVGVALALAIIAWLTGPLRWLVAGRNPRDPRNLWPEPRKSEWNAKKKDQLEFVLYKMVCRDKISLAEAQHVMATDWIEAWKRYVPDRRNYRFKRVD